MKTLRKIIMLLALVSVFGCYSVSSADSPRPEGTTLTLVVDNLSGGPIRVFDAQTNMYLGRIYSGTNQKLNISSLPWSSDQLRFDLFGEYRDVFTPPELIRNYSCWYVEVGSLNPQRDVDRTFLPCR